MCQINMSAKSLNVRTKQKQQVKLIEFYNIICTYLPNPSSTNQYWFNGVSTFVGYLMS